MANPLNDDGHPIVRRSSEPLRVQNFTPTSVSVSLLRIGQYQIQRQNANHMVAKWYYARKKLNWEILENGWKKKIEIEWSNISAIRIVRISNAKILEIELHKQPHFHGEFELRPKKSASWKPISDFTGGQASTYRIHHLEFSNDTLLETNMEPLFILDPRLRELRGRHFPSSESPFFVHYIDGAPQAPPALMNSQLLQQHQIPPVRSSVPTCSSNSNLVDSMSTVRESANRLLPSLEDSRVSDDGNPQPSWSVPRSGTILDVELKIKHSAANATASSYNPNNRRHGREGYQHDNHPNMMMPSDDPSCMRAHTRNNQAIFNQVDMEHRSGSSYYPMADDVGKLVMRTSNEPRTNDVNDHDGHDGPIDADVVSNPHQEGSSPS